MDGRDFWQNLSAAGTAAALQCHLSDCGRERRGNRYRVNKGLVSADPSPCWGQTEMALSALSPVSGGEN